MDSGVRLEHATNARKSSSNAKLIFTRTVIALISLLLRARITPFQNSFRQVSPHLGRIAA